MERFAGLGSLGGQRVSSMVIGKVDFRRGREEEKRRKEKEERGKRGKGGAPRVCKRKEEKREKKGF